MKRDVLFAYSKKWHTLRQRKAQRSDASHRGGGFLLMFDRKKKDRCTSESWLMGNISGNISEHVNFYASKAAGLDILRCQEMMILY